MKLFPTIQICSECSMFKIYTKWFLWTFVNLIFLKKNGKQENNGSGIIASYAIFSEAPKTQYPIPVRPHIWYKQYTFSNLDRSNNPVPNTSVVAYLVEAMHIFKPWYIYDPEIQLKKAITILCRCI